MTVDDGDAAAPGGAKTETSTPLFGITAVIDPPSVTSPTTAKNTPVDVTPSRNKADGNEITFFRVANLLGGALTYAGPQSTNNQPVPVTNGQAVFLGGSFFNLLPEPDTKSSTPTPGFEGVAGFDVQVGTGTYGLPVPGTTNPPPVFGGPVVSSMIAVGNAPPADTAAPQVLDRAGNKAAAGPLGTFTVTGVVPVASRARTGLAAGRTGRPGSFSGPPPC